VERIGGVCVWQLYVDWIMNVVGDCIYVMWWWIVVDYIHINFWWCWGDLYVWTYAFVVESYVHAFMTDGGGFYIQLRWYDVFVASEVTTLEEIRFHMHLDESRAIANIVGELKCIWVVHDDWIVKLTWLNWWYVYDTLVDMDLEWWYWMLWIWWILVSTYMIC
jgi:hypothetical protein